MNKYSYIYDINQARYFLRQGYQIVDIGFHRITRRTYFVFAREQAGYEEAFQEWQNNRIYKI